MIDFRNMDWFIRQTKDIVYFGSENNESNHSTQLNNLRLIAYSMLQPPERCVHFAPVESQLFVEKHEIHWA